METPRREVKTRVKGPFNHTIITATFCWYAVAVLAGCVQEPKRTYRQELVTTFAELTLLYEKEKIAHKQTDSAYQASVQKFFETKGMPQKDFQQQIDELSKNEQVWRFFIQDVSSAMDSLKTIR